MISVYPKFYKDFVCKGNQCKKTCCQRWEIDIDEDTAKTYQAMPGQLGEDIRNAMVYKEEENLYHFKLNKEGKCFLLQDGWCRIVLAKGEEGLCDICHMHPRFFKYLEDYEFCGVGLCCEKSCELLLGGSVDAQNTTYLPLEKETIIDGKRTSADITLPEILNDLGIDDAIMPLEFTPNPQVEYYQNILQRLAQTEPIDENWTAGLTYLQTNLGEAVEKAKSYLKTYDEGFFTRLYQYILYRQLDMASDYFIESVVAYAWESAEYIFLKSAYSGTPLEEAALWSEQIEYDTDNVDILLRSFES